jgi:hypothetical protein
MHNPNAIPSLMLQVIKISAKVRPRRDDRATISQFKQMPTDNATRWTDE